MAKKSQRRNVRYEKDQLGCMWGLINIFDFRHGRPTWKLISDKRHGSKQAVGNVSPRNKFEVLSGLDENFQGTLENNADTTAIVVSDACKPSVKKLMEEEMSSEQDMKKVISTDEVDSNLTDACQTRKDQKRTKKTRSRSRDMDTCNLNGFETLEPGCSCNQKQEHKSRSNGGVDEIMEEACCQIHQKHTSCVNHDLNGEAPVKSNYKHSDFEEKLCLTIKEFMNQKFTDGKLLTEDQKIQHFRELMDAIETLSSDEELFLKLLQDPNSLLAKYVLNLQDSQRDKDNVSKAVTPTEKLEDAKKPEDLVIRKQRYFFRRKSKPQKREPAEANENFEASKRIVILKPGPTVLRDSETESNKIPEPHYILRSKGPNEKIGSHFFLSDIKRKLRNAMGKQLHGVSTTANSNKLPNEHQSLEDGGKGSVKEKFGSSPSKDHFYMERIAKPSSGIKRADKSGKMEESEMNLKHEDPVIPNQRVSNIYIEAKKHLSEMLSNGDSNGDAVADISGRRFPKTLGRILSLPEYNVSPRGSPGRNSELGFVTAQMRLSPRDRVLNTNENVWSPKQEKNVSPLGQVPQNLEKRLSISDNDPDCKLQPSNSLPSTSDDLINDSEAEVSQVSTKEEMMNPEGDIDIAKEIEIVAWEEESIVDAPSEPSGSSMARDDQSGNITEIVDDERCSEWSKQDSYEETPGQSSPLSSPLSPPTTKHVEGLDIAIGIPERPSPVSVLDPLFSDDEISPSKTISQPVELPVQPLRICFEDHEYSAIDEANNAKTLTEDKELVFDFVKEVMQASGFKWDDFCMKWLSSDQLIEPSLCDDLVFCPNSLCYDQKLLFDCINEVLVEVCGRYYGCFPWVSSVKSIRPVPDMKTAIHEVWMEVHWHLLPLPSPHTLDQIVAKDLSKTGAWMDLRFDTETVGGDMGEAILQDLIEDIILSYADGSPTSEVALVSDELNESESIVNL